MNQFQELNVQQQHKPEPSYRQLMRTSVAYLSRALCALQHVVKLALIGTLNLFLAFVLLFEEWGWKPLAAALAWFARFKIIARVEEKIANLPPYPSLVVFVLPGAILFPVKIGGLALLAGGHVIKAGILLAAAKVASTALVARIFHLTRPQLMHIGWFASAYNRFIPWKDALFARVRASFAWRYGRMLKSRTKQIIRRLRVRWEPRVKALYDAIKIRAVLAWRRYFGTSVSR